MVVRAARKVPSGNAAQPTPLVVTPSRNGLKNREE